MNDIDWMHHSDNKGNHWTNKIPFEDVCRVIFFSEPHPSENIPAPNLEVFDNFLTQTFAFSIPTIHHVFSSYSSNVYGKLIQTCKYFYAKKKIVIIPVVLAVYDSDERYWLQKWHQNGFLDHTWTPTIPKMYPQQLQKVWITSNFEATFRGHPHISSKFCPKIYKCEAERLDFVQQELTEEEFNIFVNPDFVKILNINESTVKRKNGLLVPVENIVERLPKVIEFYFGDFFSTVETISNLSKFPERCSKLTLFMLYEIPPSENFAKDLYIFVTKSAAPKAHYKFISRGDIRISAENKKFIQNSMNSWIPEEEKPNLEVF